MIPVLMWDLKSLNAPKITSDFSQSQLSLPLIHPAQQKVRSAAAADILVTLPLLRYDRELQISFSTDTAFGQLLLFQGQQRWKVGLSRLGISAIAYYPRHSMLS